MFSRELNSGRVTLCMSERTHDVMSQIGYVRSVSFILNSADDLHGFFFCFVNKSHFFIPLNHSTMPILTRFPDFVPPTTNLGTPTNVLTIVSMTLQCSLTNSVEVVLLPNGRK